MIVTVCIVRTGQMAGYTRHLPTYRAPNTRRWRRGDYVIVDVTGITRLARIERVGRTRKQVGCDYKGPLKKIKRKATRGELDAYRKVANARLRRDRAEESLRNASWELRELIKKNDKRRSNRGRQTRRTR